MKRALLVAVAAVGVLALLPFAGPGLGLADFQRAAPAPGEKQVLTAGTVDFHREGEGPDVVLVHGQPGSADMMRPLARALASAGFRVTRYDRLGWGHSGPRIASEPANPTAHARDLLELIDVLELSRPLVVGYSYGGGVAMEANRLAPERLPVLGLVGSVGDRQRRGRASLTGRVLFSPLFLRWAFGTDWTARAGAGNVLRALAAPEALSASEADALLASLALPGVPTAWARERADRYVGFEHYQPEAVRACTLVLHGDDDRIVLPDVARYVASRVPDARAVWEPGAGHALILTRPDRVASRIAEHYRRCDP